MKVNYIYDGIISAFAAERSCIMLQKYPYVVEVDGIVDLVTNDILTKHTYFTEDDYSCDMVEHVGSLYGVISVTDNSKRKLYFFKTEEDKELFVNFFQDRILNFQPFRVQISQDHQNSQSLKSQIVAIGGRVCALLLPTGWRGNT